MKDALATILDSYLTVKKQDFTKNKLANFIRQTAPMRIKQKASLTDSYKIQGSVGQGNWAEVPWIGIFDKQITVSAQNGYYIVYLFASDMSGVYLSLNMGWTQFKNKFKETRLAQQKIEVTANKCKEILQSYISDFYIDPISLKTHRELGKGYELGHICGRYYPKNEMPEDTFLVDDLRNLIGVYRELKGILGKSQIITLIDWFGEAAFEEVELDDARYNKDIEKAKAKYISNTPQPKPQAIVHRGHKKWKIDPGIGKACIINANYVCEINSSHATFTSRVTNNNYVEVHHLIPMSFQDEFHHSLDIPANIVAICPNCHRELHHATKNEIAGVLKVLFDKRKVQLEQAGIEKEFESLIEFYKIN